MSAKSASPMGKLGKEKTKESSRQEALIAMRGARKYGAGDRANKDRPGPSYPHCKVVSDVRTNLSEQMVVPRTAASAAPPKPKSTNCRPSPHLSLSSAATKCWLSEASGETSVRREQRQCCETEHLRTEANPGSSIYRDSYNKRAEKMTHSL